MARFRYSGTNWEGRQWSLTPGGVALGRQVEARWPASHGADGTVASRTHDQNNPNSDHRPRPFGASPATVRALDVGEVTEGDGIEFAELLRAGRDPRLKYVLHENRIFSSYATSTRQPWTWAPLSIGHPNHVHVSFTTLADTDDSPWNLGQIGDDALLPLESGHGYADPPDGSRATGDQSHRVEDVRALQDMLNIAYGAGLTLDGLYGPGTIAAAKDNIGGYTGNPAGQQGTWVGGNQWGNLILDVAKTAGGEGPRGPKGDDGEKGEKGDPGEDGRDGAPATLTITGDAQLP